MIEAGCEHARQFGDLAQPGAAQATGAENPGG